MSKVITSRFFVGNDIASISRAVEALQQFTLEKDTVRVSAAYTLDTLDDVVLVTTGAGGITITLPPIDDAQRKSYYVKKIDAGAGAVTVQGSGSEVIDGGTVSLPNQYDVVEVIPERNTNTSTNAWWVV